MTKPIPGRLEDRRFITGRGRYTDDIRQQNALHAVFVRSPHASAEITSIATDDARRMDGVVAVLTAADLAEDGIEPFSVPLNVEGPDGRTYSQTPRPLLVADRARFVGEPLALVVATSRHAALDAAEAVEVEMNPLPAVVHLDDVLGEDAPLVWETAPGNVAFHWRKGPWDEVGAALAEAHHVARLDAPVSRVMASPMEPRNALAVPEQGGRTSLYLSHQNAQALHPTLAGMFGLDKSAIRVVAPDVGGAFGMKSGPLREECLIFWAARKLGRAVRWVGERSETFMSDEAGRDVRVRAELGLDRDGIFTALRVTMLANIGAYASGRSTVPIMNAGGIAGIYRTPLIAGEVVGLFSNALPTAPYRGAGRPDATFTIERIIDIAARETGIDPLELRLRNAVPQEAMPYETPFIFRYDNGDFATNMKVAAQKAEYAGFPARRKEAERRGKLRGIGIANPIEVAGGPFANPGTDFGTVRVLPDGTITVLSGVMSAGQGLETAMTRLVAERLGLPDEAFTYVQGDTETVPQGKGMGGSAGLSTGGTALSIATDRLLEEAKRRASDELEAAADDLVYDSGVFRIAGTDRSVSLAALARAAEAEGGLSGSGDFTPGAATFPNGCHICEVEIDPETGACTFVNYTGVEDVGQVMFDQLAMGQIHGGVAQGLGQVLCETVSMEEDGQLVSASFMDYAMPRADDFPFFTTEFTKTPTELNPLGVKGIGEAGTVGALAAGMNAICDALASAGVTDFEMPATPVRVWTALSQARKKAG